MDFTKHGADEQATSIVRADFSVADEEQMRKLVYHMFQKYAMTSREEPVKYIKLLECLGAITPVVLTTELATEGSLRFLEELRVYQQDLSMEWKPPAGLVSSRCVLFYFTCNILHGSFVQATLVAILTCSILSFDV